MVTATTLFSQHQAEPIEQRTCAGLLDYPALYFIPFYSYITDDDTLGSIGLAPFHSLALVVPIPDPRLERSKCFSRARCYFAQRI